MFEKKYNFQNLILALAVPVGVHGLWNYSLSSDALSSQIASITAFLVFLRAIFIFKDFKKRQKSKKLFHVKYYTITTNDFIKASTIVLLIFVVVNIIINLST